MLDVKEVFSDFPISPKLLMSKLNLIKTVNKEKLCALLDMESYFVVFYTHMLLS